MGLDRRRVLGLAAVAALAPHLALAAPVAVPFEIAGGKILVPIKVDGEPVHAVLDSGSVFSGLDVAFAQKIGVKATGSHVAVRGLQGRASGRYSGPVKVTVGGQDLAARMVVLDYAPLSASVGHPIEALLGGDFFAAFVVKLDFTGKVMHLHPRAGFTPPRDAYETPLRPRGLVMTMPIPMAGGQTMWALVDTGSDSPLIVSPDQARKYALFYDRKVSSTVIGGIGGASVGKVVSLSDFTVAAKAFDNVPVQVTARSIGVDANLGLGLLSRFHLWMDYGGRRMWLRPNDDETPFARDALGFFGQAEQGGIRVSHVAAGGPAEAAGLKAGDLITAINGQPALVANQALRGSVAGTKLVLTTARGATVSMTMAEYY